MKTKRMAGLLIVVVFLLTASLALAGPGRGGGWGGRGSGGWGMGTPYQGLYDPAKLETLTVRLWGSSRRSP
jgi:hypothetical protein